MNLPVRTGQDLVDKALDFIWRAVDSLAKAITVDRPQTVAVATTDTVVAHGLGRPPVGYLVIRRDANATIFDSPTPPADPNVYVILRASAAVNAVLVFV